MEYLNELPFTDEEKANMNMLKITDGIVTGVTDHRKLLGTLVLPDGITEISMFTFVGCSDLKSIVIPDSVTEIGTYAFSGCSGLTNVTISDNITVISESTFSGCTGLTSIIIPESVTEINMLVFDRYRKLKTVVIKSTVIKDIHKTAFKNVHTNIHFTVKTDAVKALLKKSPTIRDEQITVEPNL